ncbi:hypothetical protein RHCRD62_60370 [Rhodococcus sp. RD6.2]|nr:hypothetical protein RHCRD62_60370 [Rhodococcus sp. RD6.2]
MTATGRRDPGVRVASVTGKTTRTCGTGYFQEMTYGLGQ